MTDFSNPQDTKEQDEAHTQESKVRRQSHEINELLEIEVEAKSLEEARRLIQSKTPEGFYCVSEKVFSDGNPQTRRAIGGSIDIAFEEAEIAIPSGAEILERKVITAPSRQSLEVTGFDEREALAKQKIPRDAIVESLQLKVQGSRGFLGIGRRPNVYIATIIQSAVMEVVYKEVAKIRAKIKQLLSKTELINSLNDIEKQTAKQWLRLDKPIKGELVAVMVMTAAFNFLKEKVSEPFNAILSDAKLLFAGNSDIRGFAQLQLGPPNRNYDVFDMPLVSKQFEDALTRVRQLRELMEQQINKKR